MLDTVDVLQRLIRFDTTNPPGNEHAAVSYIADLLESHGIATQRLAKDPDRPNLVARIPGDGHAPPLLLQGHIDVVPTTDQPWSRDPFGGELVDGWIWGRGALDMKGGIVMMLDALVRAAHADSAPAGDVMLCVVSDEEDGGTHGARFLVEQHRELFDGVRYGIGEFGGFPLSLAGRRFYPIQIAERVGVRFRLTVRGQGGHGSLPVRGGAMARLGRVLRRLDRKRLPIHVTPATRLMLEAMIAHTDGATRRALSALLDARTAGPAMAVLGSRLGVLEPVLRNTVSPTIVRGGDKINVIPSEATVELDGRMLPGLEPEQFADEVQAIVGDNVEVTWTSEEIGVGEPDMGLFDLLADIVREEDPTGIPIPFLLPAVTDGRWFTQLGIQHYGFLPMNLPDDYDFRSTVHAADERIPAEAVQHGADRMYELVSRYGR